MVSLAEEASRRLGCWQWGAREQRANSSTDFCVSCDWLYGKTSDRARLRNVRGYDGYHPHQATFWKVGNVHGGDTADGTICKIRLLEACQVLTPQHLNESGSRQGS